jgi:ABC-type Fe3+ transport system permease subunit
MSNVYRLPKGLDGQGRYLTRDTASRQLAAEQAWVNTVLLQQQRRVPFERIERKIQRRAQNVRRLFVWAVCGWTAFFCSLFLIAVAVS